MIKVEHTLIYLRMPIVFVLYLDVFGCRPTSLPVSNHEDFCL